MVEGTARELVAPDDRIAGAILAGYAKYKAATSYEADASNWSAGGLWELTPIMGFAWSSLGVDATRYRFDPD